jgi:hypothetical protein
MECVRFYCVFDVVNLNIKDAFLSVKELTVLCRRQAYHQELIVQCNKFSKVNLVDV